MTRPAIRAGLSAGWWIVFPAFAIVVARLSLERMCGDPHNLLPQLAARPSLAWAIAAVYVAAHAWLLIAYLIAIDSDRLLPRVAAIRHVWAGSSAKFWTMLVLLAIEYAPVTLWRFVGGVTACPH